MSIQDSREIALSMIRNSQPEQIAALSGALILIPSNLHHIARLDSLAACAALGVARGRKSVTRSYARKLMNEVMYAWVGSADDPCETMATEGFTYNGGTHVLVAPIPNELFALQALASAIAKSDEYPHPFIERATSAIQFMCAVSGLVASRAQLKRNTQLPEITQDVVIPPDADLNRLMSAVRLSKNDVDHLLKITMSNQNSIEPFCFGPHSGPLPPNPPYQLDDLSKKPLLRMGDDVFVLTPHRITESTINHLVQMAVSAGVQEKLAEDFHHYLYFSVDTSLVRLGLTRNFGPAEARTHPRNSIFSHAIYQCDTDKAVHVAVVSSPFRGTSSKPESAEFKYTSEEIEEELKAARRTISSMLSQSVPPVSGWFTLVVYGSAGRNFIFSLSVPDESEPDLISFSGAELETIVFAEGRERSALLLWRYAQARKKLRARSKIFEYSAIDTYALWRERDRSFPVHDGIMMVDQTLGQKLREHAIGRYDWHGINSPVLGRVTEVGLADGPRRPIYVPRGVTGERVEFAVERSGFVAWVVSSVDIHRSDVDLSTWFEVGRMISFWISEFSGQLDADVLHAATVEHSLVVNFELLKSDSPQIAPNGYVIAKRSDREIEAIIHMDFVKNYDEKNVVERRFAADLFCVVLKCISVANAEELIAKSLDVVAPVGVKRMMHRVDTSKSPEFTCAGRLPKPRYQHAADLINVRRKILASSPLPQEPLDRNSSMRWLNNAVGLVYEDLRSLLSKFDAHQLLVRLMKNNEALIHEDAISSETLASQLACYQNDGELHQRLLEQGPNHVSAAMVTRFLIEHVAAEPPGGTQIVSDLDLDIMLAMGLEISMLGMASDIAKFELADVSVRFDEGDFIVDRGTYQEAAKGVLLALTQDQMDRASSRDRVFGYQKNSENKNPSPIIERLELASRDEFGVNLSDIGKIFGDAIAISQGSLDPVSSLTRDDFIQSIAKKLPLEFGKAVDALNVLSLTKRGSYVKPPSGFDVGDIWPWRFNRGLSYIRRPFVVLANTKGVENVYFTPGHVYRASNNLIALITSGRLKARSKHLSAVMGEFTKESSDAFNEEVGRVMRSKGFVVRTQAAKFGKEKIADPKGNSLGDVDVLCVDVLRRRIIALECKDFQIVRVPHEVRTDLESLFISTGSKRCAQDKHSKRIEWLRQHVEVVVSSMGLSFSGGQWTVDGGFVFSVALISALLGHARLPVWTIQNLRDGVEI